MTKTIRTLFVLLWVCALGWGAYASDRPGDALSTGALTPAREHLQAPAFGPAEPVSTDAKDRYTILRRTILQPVDHADPHGATFTQQVLFLIPRPAKADAPIFFVLGNEIRIQAKKLAKIYEGYGAPPDVIFATAEHRGYGTSLTAAEDQSRPAYVRIDQALADYHRVIQALKPLYPGPIMAAGYSYGGGLVIDFAHAYPQDAQVILSSSGVIDWPFLMDAYDKQVRVTLGPALYNRLVRHIHHLEPQTMFDDAWVEREFLIALLHGLVQYIEYKPYLPLLRAASFLPTPAFLRTLHWIDNRFSGRQAAHYAASNAKTSLTRAEALTGTYDWRVWRYQQCLETGIFEVSAQPGGIFTRTRDDFCRECTALFGVNPPAATNPAWSPRAMLKDLAVPLVFVAGGMDPWYGLGLEKEAPLAHGQYFYRAQGRHCPDRSDRALAKEVLAALRAFAEHRP